MWLHWNFYYFISAAVSKKSMVILVVYCLYCCGCTKENNVLNFICNSCASSSCMTWLSVQRHAHTLTLVSCTWCTGGMLSINYNNSLHSKRTCALSYYVPVCELKILLYLLHIMFFHPCFSHIWLLCSFTRDG